MAFKIFNVLRWIIEHEWPELKSIGIVASIRQESAVATEQDVSIRLKN